MLIENGVDVTRFILGIRLKSAVIQNVLGPGLIQGVDVSRFAFGRSAVTESITGLRSRQMANTTGSALVAVF